jgi:prepilin-type processing-associated H-X9-DG protein
MPMFMKWDEVDSRESYAREFVFNKLCDADGTRPSTSAFDAYSADAQTGGANVAMGDGSVRFLSDPGVVHDAQPQPVLMVIADIY